MKRFEIPSAVNAFWYCSGVWLTWPIENYWHRGNSNCGFVPFHTIKSPPRCLVVQMHLVWPSLFLPYIWCWWEFPMSCMLITLKEQLSFAICVPYSPHTTKTAIIPQGLIVYRSDSLEQIRAIHDFNALKGVVNLRSLPAAFLTWITAVYWGLLASYCISRHSFCANGIRPIFYEFIVKPH